MSNLNASVYQSYIIILFQYVIEKVSREAFLKAQYFKPHAQYIAPIRRVLAFFWGLNSLPGAIFGGLILGIAESITGGCITIEFKNTIAFLIIIMALLVKPEGLLGKEISERVRAQKINLSL